MGGGGYRGLLIVGGLFVDMLILDEANHSKSILAADGKRVSDFVEFVIRIEILPTPIRNNKSEFGINFENLRFSSGNIF